MTGENDTRSASRTTVATTSGPTDPSGAGAKLSPTALPLADAARLLSAAGGQRVTVEMLEADIAAGAPTNGDGTLNLVHYAAWLVKQAVRPLGCSAVRVAPGDDPRGVARACGNPNSLTVEQPDSLPAGGRHD